MSEFGEAALEATKTFLKDQKVVDQFVDNTVYCRNTVLPRFSTGVLGNKLCLNSNAGRESFAR